MDTQLVKLLEQTGLTEKEAQVYLALFELGQGRVMEIAKKTGLKRPIIYIILEGLIKRGYASQLPNTKVNIFQAADPSIILNKIKTTVRDLSEMLPYIRTLQNKGGKKPRLFFYDNKEAIWGVYEEMSRSKDAFFISNYALINQIFPGSVERWIRDYKNGHYGQIARHLMPGDNANISFSERISAIGQKVRIWTKLNESRMDFTLYGNKLAITLLDEEPFIFVVESKELADSMRPFFELAWERGKEIKFSGPEIPANRNV
jgi:predicted DNA-binding transcriptional regulator